MDRESSNVRIKFTEYDSINELVTDLSGPKLVKSISKNGWVKVGPDQYILRVPTKGFLMLKRKKGMWSGFFRYDTLEFRAQPFSIPLQSDDLINAIQAADTYVQQKFGNMDGIQYQISRYARYRKDDVTEAQRRALERYKIETPENMTKGQAMDLLTKLKFGQLKIWKTQLKADAVKQKLEEKRIRTADLVVERLVPTIS
jgi:ATP-dependent helicase IRC3